MAYSILNASTGQPVSDRAYRDDVNNFINPSGRSYIHVLPSLGGRPPVASASMTGGPRNRASDLLHSLLAEANQTPRNMIDEAAVGAKSAADTAYGAMIRNLSRMGVNPQAPRFAATMKDWAANRAAMEAAARNQASRSAQDVRFGRLSGLMRYMGDTDEAERNRQFQREMASEGRNFNLMMTQQGRRWNLQDRDSDAGARRAEAEETARILDAYGNSQRTQPAAPSPVARPAAPGLIVPAHTPANFPARGDRLRRSGGLSNYFLQEPGTYEPTRSPSLSNYF